MYENPAETGLYYLKSRYYDPEVGRLINADDSSNLGANSDYASLNLFACCGNNPISRTDDSGKVWHIIVGAIIGGIVGGISAALSGGDKADILIGVGAGMIGGALTASGVGAVGQIIGGAAISMASNAAQQTNKILKGKQGSFDYIDMAIDGIIGGICGTRGGSGASFGNVAGIEAAEKTCSNKVFLNLHYDILPHKRTNKAEFSFLKRWQNDRLLMLQEAH